MYKSTFIFWFSCLILCALNGQAQQVEVVKPFGPFSEGNMQDFTIDDQGNGYAVGSCGIIRISKDGGNSWETSNIGQEIALRKVVIYANTNGQKVAVFSPGFIFTSEDGGQNWSSQEWAVPTPSKLFSFGSDNLFYFSASGHFIRTDDSGENWVQYLLPPSTSTAPKDVDFVNQNKGWLTVGKHEIYTTENGGKTWQLIYATIERNIQAIDFVNDSLGYMVFSDKILKTVDGGQDWDVQFTQPSILAIKSFHVDHKGNFWVINSQEAFVLPEAPNTEILRFDIPYRSFKFSLIGPDNSFWILSIEGNILRTTKEEKIWSGHHPIGSVNAYDIAFPAREKIIVLSDSSKFYISENGGIDWQVHQAEIPSNNSFLTNLIPTKGNQIVLRNDREIVLFDGQNFRQIPPPENTQSIFQLIYEPNQKQFFLLVRLAGSRQLYRTDENFSAWELIHTFNFPASDFTMSNDQTIIARGNRGNADLSTDGGLSWRQLLSNEPFSLISMNFTNDQYGAFGTLSDPNLITTTDGGYNFNTYSTGGYLLAILFQNQNTIWALRKEQVFVSQVLQDPSTELIKSTDGGKSWEVVLKECQFFNQLKHDPFTGDLYILGSYLPVFNFNSPLLVLRNDQSQFFPTHNSERLCIFPNPADQQFTIDINSINEPISQAHLYSTDGRFITTFQLSGKARTVIDSRFLAKGGYILQAIGEKNTYSEKVIIQHY